MRNYVKYFAAMGVAASFLALAPSPSSALVMDFGTGSTTTIVTTPFSQNGLTMTPVNTGSGANPSHWDILATLFGTPADNNANIHRGNNGEEVSFQFMGGAAFDLLSVFVEGFILTPVNIGGLTATFAASSGASFTVSDTDPAASTINFAAMSGWSNITSFSISVPVLNAACGSSVDCSNFSFDDIAFQAHVPSVIDEPGTLAILGLGLAGLGFARRKR